MDGIKEDIKEQLISRLIPIAVDLALDNFDEIEEFLMHQAAATDTSIDDYMIGIFLSWLKSWLQEQVAT